MEKPNLKTFAIIGLIVITITLFVVVSLLSKGKNSPASQAPRSGPSPTLVQQPKSSSAASTRSSNAAPTLIPVDTFTGAAKDQDIPKEDTELAVAKRALRKKTPLAVAQFTIEFDYGNDQFTVTLKEPKEEAKTEFAKWLKTNYPSLPLDRFRFN